MHVLLEVVSGPHVGQRFNPQEGLVWRFGQTEWADFSFPNDTLMEEFAFRLDCRDQRCLLQALGSTPTLVNGQPADELVLSPGDRLFAGETELLVTIDGLSAAPESGDDAGQSDEGDGAAAAGLAFASAAELAKSPLRRRRSSPNTLNWTTRLPALRQRRATRTTWFKSWGNRAITFKRSASGRIRWGRYRQ